MIAVGYLGETSDLPEAQQKRELGPRSRKALKDQVFTGKWGQTAPFIK
jgi:hypothetical protein